MPHKHEHIRVLTDEEQAEEQDRRMRSAENELEGHRLRKLLGKGTPYFSYRSGMYESALILRFPEVEALLSRIEELANGKY